MPSTSRANGVAAATVATKEASKKWQFVNVSEPKKNQDKDVISIVRAHAMRNVRRKQRLEITAQHRKRIKAIASQPHHADPDVTVEDSLQMNPYDWFIAGNGDTNWLAAMRGKLSKLEPTDLGHLASGNDAGSVAEWDEYAQRLDDWQGYREDEIQASIRLMLGKCWTGTPKSLVGAGLCDPFDAMPISAHDNYNSHVLNHCTYLPATNSYLGRNA